MSDPRLLAFYLPQFHPIPENDLWWGGGHTEWTSVRRARPGFAGHDQPRVPGELGYYDLRDPGAREAQAALAREHGIAGFCYYHYWFEGRRLLERPFQEVLASGKPDFPFCLCWANENWTRTWDGGDDQVLLLQRYGDDDDRAHIRALLPALRDPRYIRVGGRPLLLVYRTELLPDAARTAAIWREEARAGGVGDLHLARVEGFDASVDPTRIGFDAGVEFAPDWRRLGRRRLLTRRWGRENEVYRYDAMVRRMLAKPVPTYPWYRCVTPGFDNSPRRRVEATVLLGSTPEKYGRWLEAVASQARRAPVGDARIVFVNAWNEWGEGNYLEPDGTWGRRYLEATRDALVRAGAGAHAHPSPGAPLAGGR